MVFLVPFGCFVEIKATAFDDGTRIYYQMLQHLRSDEMDRERSGSVQICYLATIYWWWPGAHRGAWALLEKKIVKVELFSYGHYPDKWR